MARYKDCVDKMGLHPSDRKKLLALPFHLAKHQELPTPKFGQLEMDLFEELYGRRWDEDALLIADDEFKITEFNYEQYIHPEALKGMNVSSETFKDYVKLTNLGTTTKYEELKAQREEFKELMYYLAHLNKHEMESLVHLMRNKSPE